jgi:hypothetical protein
MESGVFGFQCGLMLVLSLAAMPEKKPSQDHPLANILINVLIPVLALSYLSKDPEFQETIGKAVRPWHLGPVKALAIALSLPIGYGAWFFIKNRKANFFSALGLVSVLLTGGLTLYLWNADGTVKPNAHILFGLKEASIPLILAVAVIGSHWTPNPLLRIFLYSDSFFDIRRIETRIDEIGAQSAYQRLLLQSTWLFSASFLLSTVMNFFLAIHFLGGIDHAATNAREIYNTQVAKLTGWGFAVIGVPILVFLFFTMWRLLKGLRTITGMNDDELMLPR